ncbi:uncharacterized protein LOC108676411 [Hyalella azteca]|uniref:Uncharacterized protein LOC108676411 n=1 Tax=Hyalella azteca TaxID=294128 RepID=A0A8B7P1S9_HYAAZ|nr:uncharacterized protein LOC108676411 [Hyalella azteca]XP_047740973.1 uncharacterized protein LOC108676411 [Hyalella azteca]
MASHNGHQRAGPLLLLTIVTLLGTAADAVVFQTIMMNVTVLRPDLNMTASAACECKAKCFVLPKCSAASYDITTSVCSMTYDAPCNVTTTFAPGVISLFKFVLREAFITEDKTVNGSPDNLKKMCGAEGGVPLIINTKQLLREARQLVADHGIWLMWGANRVAWLSAYRTPNNGPYHWPDNSPVIGCVFTANDFFPALFADKAEASVLRDDGKIGMLSEQLVFINALPVLCARTL